MGWLGQWSRRNCYGESAFLFVLALYDLLVFSSGQYSFARCWLIWMQSCALCPFGLTCQQLARSGTLGTLWDWRMNIFHVYINALWFCDNFLLGNFTPPSVAQSWACHTARQGHNMQCQYACAIIPISVIAWVVTGWSVTGADDNMARASLGRATLCCSCANYEVCNQDISIW